MGTASYTGPAAVARAKKLMDNQVLKWPGKSLKFVRFCYGVAPKYKNAKSAWDGADKKHRLKNYDSVPLGVPVFWDLDDCGHIAISIGGGRCLSTDILRLGNVDLVKMSTITSRWGADFLGYTEDLNDATVYTPPRKDPPAYPAGLRVDASSPSAKTLQAQLKKAGFLDSRFVVRDLYDEETQLGVESFHKRHSRTKLSDIRQINPEGWNVLFTKY